MKTLLDYKLTWKTHTMCFIVAFIMTLFLSRPIDHILSTLYSSNFLQYPTSSIKINYFIYAMAILIPIIIVHEGIHGLTMHFFGRKVKYGFKGIYAYTQDLSGTPLPREQFLWVLLTPLMGISLITLFLPNTLGGSIYLLNMFGCSGDVYMAFLVLKYRNGCKIIDKNKGFEVIG